MEHDHLFEQRRHLIRGITTRRHSCASRSQNPADVWPAPASWPPVC
jgi:hypothetical protein